MEEPMNWSIEGTKKPELKSSTKQNKKNKEEGKKSACQ